MVIFFPEGLIAAALVLASPIWFLSLLVGGEVGAALVLAAGVASGCLVGHSAWVRKDKWLLYAAVVVLLLTAIATLKVQG